MRLAEFLLESSNSQLARHYTDALNSRFRPEGIPIKITTHLVDRLNDPRNQDPIKLSEVADFFSKLLLKKKELLQNMEDGTSIQVMDYATDITIPFIKSEGVLIAATIMRGEMRRGSQQLVAI